MKKSNPDKRSFSLNRMLKIERNKVKRAKKRKYMIHMEEAQRIAFLKNRDNSDIVNGGYGY